MIFSKVQKKQLTKLTPFHDKNLQTLNIDEMYLNIVKLINRTSPWLMSTHGEKFEDFSLRSGTRQRGPFSSPSQSS